MEYLPRVTVKSNETFLTNTLAKLHLRDGSSADSRALRRAHGRPAGLGRGGGEAARQDAVGGEPANPASHGRARSATLRAPGARLGADAGSGARAAVGDAAVRRGGGRVSAVR